MFVSFIATLFYINIIRKTQINVAIKAGFYILIIFCIFGILLNSSIIQSSSVNLVILISISVFSDKFMRPGLETELFSIFKEKAASALAVNIASFSLITAPMTAACAHTFDGTPKSILLWMICPGILTIVLYYVKSKIRAV